jgi:hypothetical protein
MIQVRKQSGELEAFQIAKLEKSLHNAGATQDIIQIILVEIEKYIYEGIETRLIYQRAFSILEKYKISLSVRYKLKQAILELGPTGYPFENLIGQLFEHKGFTCEVGVMVKGRCISHEMDVIATGNHVQHLVECKYHLSQGNPVSIQVPLYVRSRVNDIIDYRELMPEYHDFVFTGWVITNTRLSLESIEYGRCSGLNLLGWNYPQGNGLNEQLEQFKLYPITVMTNLNKMEKQVLIDRGIVTCRQILKKPDVLKVFDFNEKKNRAVLKEAEDISGF